MAEIPVSIKADERQANKQNQILEKTKKKKKKKRQAFGSPLFETLASDLVFICLKMCIPHRFYSWSVHSSESSVCFERGRWLWPWRLATPKTAINLSKSRHSADLTLKGSCILISQIESHLTRMIRATVNHVWERATLACLRLRWIHAASRKIGRVSEWYA